MTPGDLLAKLLIGWGLMAACVLIHSGGLAGILHRLDTQPVVGARFFRWTWMFVRIAGWIIVLHLAEIAVWGFFFTAIDAMPDVHDALYFSSVTYTTTGYGDLVLPAEWRLVGGIEALTGILMCGWSTGFFFAIVSRMLDRVPAGERR